MIHEIVKETAKVVPERDFIVSPARTYDYSKAWKAVECFAMFLMKRKITRYAFYSSSAEENILGVIAAASVGVQACILNRNYSLSDLQEIIQRFDIDAVFSDDIKSFADAAVYRTAEAFEETCLPGITALQTVDDSRVMILTSGTTGPPKGAIYNWSDLLAQARRNNDLDGSRWLLIYNPNHFASFQVLVHAVANRGTIIIPKSQSISDVVEASIRYDAGYISATPTFWRMFAGFLSHSQKPIPNLKHITIGGEPATEELLNEINKLFPSVPISQVFATTEFGSCFSVKDGLPGFPASYLQPGKTRVPLKITDGELYVKAPHSMTGYWGENSDSRNQWHGTGDLVETKGDRVFFLGRKTEIINVGGVKVAPHKIETAILRVEGIAGARVYGFPNPISGQIVAADIVLRDGFDQETVLEYVRETCRMELDRYHQPRRLQIVENLSTTNQKIMRRPFTEANASCQQ